MARCHRVRHSHFVSTLPAAGFLWEEDSEGGSLARGKKQRAKRKQKTVKGRDGEKSIANPVEECYNQALRARVRCDVAFGMEG